MFVQGIQALDTLSIHIYYELLIHAYSCYEVKYNQMSGNESQSKKVEFNACAFKKYDDYCEYLHITMKLVNTSTEIT